MWAASANEVDGQLATTSQAHLVERPWMPGGYVTTACGRLVLALPAPDSAARCENCLRTRTG